MRTVVFVALFVSGNTLSVAQNLINSGATINNSGTIRVKDQAIGLPAAVDGVFEYFGANQNIPATQYKNLMLTGSGVKTTVGGSFSVSQNLTVAAPVTLKVQSGSTITLLGDLIEHGHVEGSIRKTEDLSGAMTSSNFGNIGITLSWTIAPPGITTVNRVSGVASTGNGKQSILRYYDIAPTFNSNLNVSMVFRYSDDELNGQDANTLELWRSIDGGLTWRRQGGTVNTLTRTITKNGIKSLSRWTASDASHPLGPLDYEWVAKNLAITSGDGVSGLVNQSVPPFVVTVTDAYGNPIAGTTVTFTIESVPQGASGQTLSTYSAVTGDDGKASTVLTLGSVAGLYTVSATAAGLSGSPAIFRATATPGAAASMVMISGSGQTQPITTTLATPLAVRVVDAGGNPVQNVIVSFNFIAVPLNSQGHRLSTQQMSTDVNGIASTVLTLGTKVGTYIVQASLQMPGVSPIVFSATATHGPAASFVLTSGNNQVGVVGSTLRQPLVVTVVDVGGNAVPGVPVQFGFLTVPENANGQSLSTRLATTDANGHASTSLTLGDKVGIYRIVATSTALSGSFIVFEATATFGAPVALVQISGSGQFAPILTRLSQPFVVAVVDAKGNPVSGVEVEWTLTTMPTGSTGQLLDVLNSRTDGQGNALASLVLGNRVGLYVVEARLSGLGGSTVTFTAQAVAGAPASIVMVSGNEQSGEPGSLLPNPLVVQLFDVGGNAVPNAVVRFEFSDVPSGATGHSLTVTNGITNAQGLVATQLRLGDVMGTYRVSALVEGLPPVVFTAFTRVIVGDANNDKEVNIADLTSVIDHILGRVTLTGIDSIKADVNLDKTISVLDVVLIQRYLLAEVQELGAASAGRLVPLEARLNATSSSSAVRGDFELTPYGVRFYLRNNVQVHGIQLILRYRTAPPIKVDSIGVVFSRAHMMTMPVNTTTNELRVVAFNMENIPIDPGYGAIFRFPSSVRTLGDVESMELIVSTGTGIHQAVRGPIDMVTTPITPLSFLLEQNYPNPFNPSTTIEFEVPDDPSGFINVALVIYNELGQRVKTLVDSKLEAGRYKRNWDGTDDSGMRVSSGMYYYRLLSRDYQSAKRMILLR